MKRFRSPHKSIEILAVLAVAIAAVFSPGTPAVIADILPFEPGDTLEEIRYKIDYNGYSFTVEENRIFNMPAEEKASFFSRHRPLSPRRRSAGDEIGPLAKDLGKKALPERFDWRNYYGHSYIGPVKDQGNCGSCYAFGAAAAAEGTYNFAVGKYDANRAVFSEAFIAFCLDDHYSGFAGCAGANYDYDELKALVDYGICTANQYPYTDHQQECPFGTYPELIPFESWHRVPCGDIEAIKTAIMTYGVVDAAVFVGDAFMAYAGGVYQDSNISCNANPCYYTASNHAIALVGWDDNPPEGGGGCWILRNSWGSGWGEDGYMRIRYNSAVVSCASSYLVYRQARDLRIASFNVSHVMSLAGVESSRIFQGLEPDIALIQEWAMNDGDHRGYVDEAFGPGFRYVLGYAPAAATKWLQNNGVVSRWAMQTWGGWKDNTGRRPDFAWAQIDLPGETDLLAVSVHLKAGDAADDKQVRIAQANLIKTYVEDYQATQGFEGYVIVGGDWNFKNEDDAALDIFETFLEPTNHRPADQDGNENTNMPRERPYDWLAPNQLLDDRHTTLVIGLGNYEYPGGIVFDSDLFWYQGTVPPDPPVVGQALWNLPKVLYGDSQCGKMDHLAIMKAFEVSLPVITPVPGITSTPTPRPAITPVIVSGPISGRVYDRKTGAGIPSVYVMAMASGQSAGGYTDNNGYYRTGTLNAGTYTVYADTFNQTNYRSQYYNQKDAPTSATLVASNIGSINFPLYRRWEYPTPVPATTPVPTAVPAQPTPRLLWLPSLVDAADFDGDGTSDIATYRPSTGLWAVRGVTRLYFGRRMDLLASGDYTGDGTSNVAVFRPVTGLWAIRGLTRAYFGRSGDFPVGGDYDGDGFADIAVFRPSSGLWAIRNLSRLYFGRSGDLPVPFPGDGGETEIAVFRPATGLWAVRGLTRVYFGADGDSPVPGNYRGLLSGDMELGVFRDSSGLWAVRGQPRIYYGTRGDWPAPRNYRGDLQTDIAIFRGNSGLWAIRNLTRVYFGQFGDRPVSGLAVNPSGTILP